MKKMMVFIFYVLMSGVVFAANMDANVSVCPVLGDKINKSISTTYNGKTYYFCCAGCIDAFNVNPEKYISKIKTINFEASQFQFTPDKITVKKGDIVQLLATSKDVPHGIAIKEFKINVPLKKGDVKTIEFLADKAGTFSINCSVYCGAGHSKMSAQLVVEE